MPEEPESYKPYQYEDLLHKYGFKMAQSLLGPPTTEYGEFNLWRRMGIEKGILNTSQISPRFLMQPISGRFQIADIDLPLMSLMGGPDAQRNKWWADLMIKNGVNQKAVDNALMLAPELRDLEKRENYELYGEEERWLIDRIKEIKNSDLSLDQAFDSPAQLRNLLADSAKIDAKDPYELGGMRVYTAYSSFDNEKLRAIFWPRKEIPDYENPDLFLLAINDPSVKIGIVRDGNTQQILFDNAKLERCAIDVDKSVDAARKLDDPTNGLPVYTKSEPVTSIPLPAKDAYIPITAADGNEIDLRQIQDKTHKTRVTVEGNPKILLDKTSTVMLDIQGASTGGRIPLVLSINSDFALNYKPKYASPGESGVIVTKQAIYLEDNEAFINIKLGEVNEKSECSECQNITLALRSPSGKRTAFIPLTQNGIVQYTNSADLDNKMRAQHKKLCELDAKAKAQEDGIAK